MRPFLIYNAAKGAVISIYLLEDKILNSGHFTVSSGDESVSYAGILRIPWIQKAGAESFRREVPEPSLFPELGSGRSFCPWCGFSREPDHLKPPALWLTPHTSV